MKQAHLLVAEGKTESVIVLGKKPEPGELHAARELQKFIRFIGGAEVPILDGPSDGCFNIFIGSTGDFEELCLPDESLGIDGYIIKTTKRSLILAGNAIHSCLYAVYHFLNQYCGCGFFEDGDRIPPRETIVLPEIDIRERPFFRYRKYPMAGIEMYGARWWDFEEWKKYLDWGAKHRYNVLDQQEKFVTGFVQPFIWRRLGVQTELTDWQKEQIDLRQKMFDYARMLGMKIQFSCVFYESQGARRPGNYAWADSLQFDEFIERSPTLVPLLTNSWSGVPFPWIDPRTDFAREVVRIGVEELIRLFGTDHLYALRQPSEDSFIDLSLQEQQDVIRSVIVDMRTVIQEVDPQARIEGGWSGWEWSLPEIRQAQLDAMREAVGAGHTFIAAPGIEPGRLRQERVYQRENYFEGTPWWTGVIGMGAGTVNFFGDLAGTIREMRILADDPKGIEKCEGFMLWPEAIRRNLMAVELYSLLGWADPREVELGNFLQRYALARYGAEAGPKLLPALEKLAASVYSFNSNACGNIPLHRTLAAAGEMTELNNNNLLKFMPEVHAALEVMVAQKDVVGGEKFYQFDLVDMGREYLGMKITEYVLNARRAFYHKEKEQIGKLGAKTERALRLLAKLTSGHPWFRLRTEEEWASRWPEFFPGASNVYCNRIGRTTLFTKENWVLDYYGDDLCELVLYYYLPRVKAYLGAMVDILESGDESMWRQAIGAPNIKDNTIEHGDFYWGKQLSGPLMRHDRDIILGFIENGYPKEQIEYYEGSIAKLVEEVLADFPLQEIV